MRSLLLAVVAALTLSAGSAAAFPGEYEIPSFPLPNIAAHQAIYGTPDDPKYWEGPDLNDVSLVVFRSHGLIDLMFNFKIKDATPGAIVTLGSHIGVVSEDGTFESGWVPSYTTSAGYGFDILVIGPLYEAGATRRDPFDMYDFMAKGTQGPAVPEPATWALMILGFGAVGASVRRRRAAVAERYGSTR